MPEKKGSTVRLEQILEMCQLVGVEPVYETERGDVTVTLETVKTAIRGIMGLDIDDEQAQFFRDYYTRGFAIRQSLSPEKKMKLIEEHLAALAKRMN